MSRDFTAKEVVPGTFDVHFYKPDSTSLVADVLEYCFDRKWIKSGNRSLLRTLKWKREGGSGIAVVGEVSTTVDIGIPLFTDDAGGVHTEVCLRVGLSGSDGRVCPATVRIFVPELPSSALVEEFVGSGTAQDLVNTQLMRNRVRSGEVCPHCFRSVDDCDCCDGDVDPELEAKG